MENEICILSDVQVMSGSAAERGDAENRDHRFLEAVTAAETIQRVTKYPISVLAFGDSKAFPRSLPKCIRRVYRVATKNCSVLQEAAFSDMLYQALKRIRPFCVLLPAGSQLKTVLSRAAFRMDAGVSADCTELDARETPDGSWKIQGEKPSFGNQIMVTIEESCTPQIFTLADGSFVPEKNADSDYEGIVWNDIAPPGSEIQLISAQRGKAAEEAAALQAAELVLCAGRGAEDGSSLELIRKIAEDTGAGIGCTRPLADQGVFPFECQIGQTGCTVRPAAVLSCGVSGALQHTEGIRDQKILIAINRDRNAPIFHFADYGVVSELEPVLRAMMQLLEKDR